MAMVGASLLVRYIVIPALFSVPLYFVIKKAVKDAIKETRKELDENSDL